MGFGLFDARAIFLLAVDERRATALATFLCGAAVFLGLRTRARARLRPWRRAIDRRAFDLRLRAMVIPAVEAT